MNGRSLSNHAYAIRSAEIATVDRGVLIDVLDHLAIAVIVVDPGARVVFLNESARGLLSRRDGMRLDRDRLELTGAEAHQRLTAILARVSRLSVRARRHCAEVVVIDRDSAEAPLHACVAPLAARTVPVATAIFIHDPERAGAVDEGLFRQLYSLTPSESKLALQLLRGRSITEAAGHLGVSVNTAKSHLKELFRKTSTRRQSELVRRLSTGLATLEISL